MRRNFSIVNNFHLFLVLVFFSLRLSKSNFLIGIDTLLPYTK